MIIRILKSMKKDKEIIKKDQSEIKNSLPEINNTLEVINSRLDEAGDQISDLEDKVEKKTPGQSTKNKKEFKEKEESLRNILDNVKQNNIQIMGMPEGAESKQRIKKLFEEIMTENFPNLVREKDTQSSKLKESQTKWTQRGPH